MRYLISGLVKLMTGIWKSPNYATAWVGWLITVNLLAPLLFWSHPEARVIAVVFLAGGTLMGSDGKNRFQPVARTGARVLVPAVILAGYTT